MKSLLRPVWPDRISHEELVAEIDAATQIPGQTNAFTMPIKNRTDMLSTGIRTPVGIKILGADVNELERIGGELERIIRQVSGTRSVFAERAAGGYFLDFDLKRDALARYGLTVDDANDVVMSAIGGANVTTTVEGRERYSVNLRYPRELPENVQQLGRVLVQTKSGAHIPMGELADIRSQQGPSMIRDENGLVAAYVFVDFDTSKRDIGGYVTDAKRAIEQQLPPTPGYTPLWSGQFENMARVRERLKIVVPVTLLLNVLLLYATRSQPRRRSSSCSRCRSPSSVRSGSCSCSDTISLLPFGSA